MAGIIGLEILAMREAAEKMTPYKRPDCPVCGWALEVSVDDITHCKFCGWQDQSPIKREVPRP